ncbi:MAG TPA: helix-turn-helix domain-containing protein [Gaiellaceae bacterium]|nr:helix-turn-helix domain-containing protein [Gaiellaceae bacterium]
MLAISPEDRAIMWREALAHRGDDRLAHLRFIASDLLVALHSSFDLYMGYEDDFVETIVILADRDLFLDNDMLSAYQALGADDEEAPGRLLALVVSRLGDLAGSGTAASGRAGELAELWSEVLSSKEEEDVLTVAQVAARYRVTPQAVYKWIHAGKVDAEETPGGSYRIAASQFRTKRELQERRRELRRRLAQRTGADGDLSDEELVAAIRESRRD